MKHLQLFYASSIDACRGEHTKKNILNTKLLALNKLYNYTAQVCFIEALWFIISVLLCHNFSLVNVLVYEIHQWKKKSNKTLSERQLIKIYFKHFHLSATILVFKEVLP